MGYLKKYPYRTELHLHTSPASPCSEILPRQAVEKYAEAGYHSIVITNHFYPTIRFKEDRKRCIETYIEDYELAEEAGKEYGINVILGCEFRFTENGNDYLLFGIEKSFLETAYDSMDMGIEAFSKMFRSEEHLLIQAHPMRKNMVMVNPKYLDGVEAFNMNANYNARCAECAFYARAHGLIMIAGSDCHHFCELGTTALRTKTEMKTSHDIVRALKKRDYVLEIGGCILLP